LGALGVVRSTDAYLLAGELSLDGSVRAVRGALSMAVCARREGIPNLVVPAENAAEAAVVEGINAFGVRHLAEVVALVNEPERFSPARPGAQVATAAEPQPADFRDVRGQTSAKRALEVAAAGGGSSAAPGPTPRHDGRAGEARPPERRGQRGGPGGQEMGAAIPLSVVPRARLARAALAKPVRRPAKYAAPIGAPRCPWCDNLCANPACGDGRCSRRHGEGRVRGDANGEYEEPIPCPACGGTGDCPVCFGSGTLHDEFGEFSTERADDSHPALARTRTATPDRTPPGDEQEPVLYDGLPDETALGAYCRRLLDASRDRR